MAELMESADDYRILGDSYGSFSDYRVIENDHAILFTFKPINWIYTLNLTFILSLCWIAFLYLCSGSDDGQFAYLELMFLGFLVCGWPIYVPLIRRSVVKSPFLKVDYSNNTVELSGGNQSFALPDVFAICDILATNAEFDNLCEIQILIKNDKNIEPYLLAKSLENYGSPSKNMFTPSASELARLLGVKHFSVDLIKKTVHG